MCADRNLYPHPSTVRLETRFTHCAKPGTTLHHVMLTRITGAMARAAWGWSTTNTPGGFNFLTMTHGEKINSMWSVKAKSIYLGEVSGALSLVCLRVCFRAGSSHHPILLVASREHLKARTCLGNTGKLVPALEVETQLVFQKTKTSSF